MTKKKYTEDWYHPTKDDEQELRAKCYQAVTKIISGVFEKEFNANDDEELNNSDVVKEYLAALIEVRKIEKEFNDSLELQHPTFKNHHDCSINAVNMLLTVIGLRLMGWENKEVVVLQHDLTKAGWLLKSLLNTFKALDAFDSIYCSVSEDDLNYFRVSNAPRLLALSESGITNEP